MTMKNSFKFKFDFNRVDSDVDSAYVYCSKKYPCYNRHKDLQINRQE